MNIYGERAFPSSNTWALLGLLNPATSALAGLAPNYFDEVLSTGYQDKDLVNEEENEEKIYKKPKIVDKQIETTSKENNIEKKDKTG